MPETLCIAELQDGRRALAYINQVAKTAQLVLVLRPDDMVPKSVRMKEPEIPRKEPIHIVDIDNGKVVGWVVDPQVLNLPPRMPEPRITVDDLLTRGAQLAPSENISPEDQIIRDIQAMGDDPEAPAVP